MRWISKDEVEECLTEEWRQAAAEALKSLQDAKTIEERKAILKKATSSDIWRKFYKLLPESLKKKCWYCEAQDVRSDMPVDHFRPKNQVEDEKSHEGYWWLAFDWKNYRCACTFCNSRRNFDESSGGKACRFPLVDPNKRAYTPTDNHSAEKPAFLDPFDPDDWKLLWFDNDGAPMAISDTSELQKKKVDNSIDIFHLHETKIVRERNNVRLAVMKKIKELKEAQKENNEDAVRDVKNTLRKMVKETEKLSRAAIVYLSPYRGMSEIKEILNID